MRWVLSLFVTQTCLGVSAVHAKEVLVPHVVHNIALAANARVSNSTQQFETNINQSRSSVAVKAARQVVMV